MMKIRDFLWCLVAYCRGRVLRQKAYRPVISGLVRFPLAMNVRRMTMLMRWWGMRPATTDEFAAFIGRQINELRVPELTWDGSDWGQRWSHDWDTHSRFLTTRKW
jgi:hypothetical protein